MDIDSFCDEEGVTTKQELYDKHGEPREVVNNYLSLQDTDYIVKRIRTASFFKSFVVITLILATIATSAYCVFLYHKHQSIEESFRRNEVAMMEEVIVVEEIRGDEFIYLTEDATPDEIARTNITT